MTKGPVTPKPSDFDRCRAAFETAARGELTAYEQAHGLARYRADILQPAQLRDTLRHGVDWQWKVRVVNGDPVLFKEYVRPTEAVVSVNLLRIHAANTHGPTNVITLAPMPRDLENCPRCDRWKPADEFYAHKHTANGKQTYCKQCHRELSAASYRRRKAA